MFGGTNRSELSFIDERVLRSEIEKSLNLARQDQYDKTLIGIIVNSFKRLYMRIIVSAILFLELIGFGYLGAKVDNPRPSEKEYVLLDSAKYQVKIVIIEGNSNTLTIKAK